MPGNRRQSPAVLRPAALPAHRRAGQGSIPSPHLGPRSAPGPVRTAAGRTRVAQHPSRGYFPAGPRSGRRALTRGLLSRLFWSGLRLGFSPSPALPLFPCPFPVGGQPRAGAKARSAFAEAFWAQAGAYGEGHGAAGAPRGDARPRPGRTRSPLPPGEVGSAGEPPVPSRAAATVPSRPPCPAILSLLTGSLVFVGCKAQGAGLAYDDTLQPPVEPHEFITLLNTAGVPPGLFLSGAPGLTSVGAPRRQRVAGPGPAQTCALCEPLLMWLGTMGCNKRHMDPRGQLIAIIIIMVND